MDLYERKKPRELVVYPRLGHRFDVNHLIQSWLIQQVDIKRAAHFGELKTDQIIDQLEMPHLHLKDIHMKIGEKTYLQLDTLVITPQAICVIETKTIRGTLRFEKNPSQLVRRHEGEELVMKCPEHQLSRQIHNLTSYLEKYHLKDIPIVGVIHIPFH